MEGLDTGQMIQSAENAKPVGSGITEDSSEHVTSSSLEGEVQQPPTVAHDGELAMKASKTPNPKYQLTALPTEILSQIFEELGWMLLTEKARLCHVCKALLPIARTFLYRNNCFIPSLVKYFYSSQANPRPYSMEENSMSTTQRSILFCRALLSDHLGEMTLGMVAVDFSHPETASAWPRFQIFEIHRIMQEGKVTISDFRCWLPAPWIDAEFVKPFLHANKATKITLYLCNPGNRNAMQNPSSLCILRSEKEEAYLRAIFDNQYRLTIFDEGPGRYAGSLHVYGHQENVLDFLGICGSRISDLTIAVTASKQDWTLAPQKCPKLHFLQLCLYTNEFCAKSRSTWVDTSTPVLQISAAEPLSPASLAAMAHELHQRMPRLQLISFLWERPRSTLATDVKAWLEIESFCQTDAVERLAVTKKLVELKCRLHTALVTG